MPWVPCYPLTARYILLDSSDLLSGLLLTAFYVFLYLLLIPSYCIHIILCLFPFLYFRFAYLSKTIKLLFPLRYPIICDTLIFRWYTYEHMNMIWACVRFYDFYRLLFAQFSKYKPISAFLSRQLACLRYLGANAIVTRFTIGKGHMKHDFSVLINPRT